VVIIRVRLNENVQRLLRVHTFALQPLPEEAFQQLFAVLADSRTGVRVDQKGVGNFDLCQQNLVQLNGTTDV